MKNEIEIVTNNKARPLICDWELTPEEREDVRPEGLDLVRPDDYWQGFRYRGVIYGLGEFMPVDRNSPSAWRGWDGYSPETYFSGVLIKLSDDGEQVTVGRYYS